MAVMSRPNVRPVERAAEETAQAARAAEGSAGAQVEYADRRTELAADRTVLAAERTYSAWVRTGLAALASGVGARALLHEAAPAWLGLAAGAALILFSAFCFVAGVWRELNPGPPPPRPDTRRLPAPLLVAVNGLMVLVAMAALAGVLSTPSP
jgi:putative membrane protein